LQQLVPELRPKLPADVDETAAMLADGQRESDRAATSRRRCLYHWIDYPTPEAESRIVELQAPGMAAELRRQLIWMNPMLRYSKFEPKASGVRAMLPHVDRFVSAHNLVSFGDLCRLLSNASSSRTAHRASNAA
jgi:MoxR-like ATPase